MFALPPRSQSSRALTLTELLVAIAVVCVLAALAIPLLGRIRENGQLVGCLNNLKQLGSASLTYAAEHQGLLPRGDIPQPGKTDSYTQWPYVLDQYFGVYFLDLLDDRPRFRKSPFSCPEETGTSGYNYAMNRQLNERLAGSKAFIRVSQLANPSRYVLFSDGYHDRTIFSDLRSKMVDMTRMTRRHRGTPNFVYADGHAAPYTGPLYGVSDAEGRNNPEIRAMWEYNYLLR